MSTMSRVKKVKPRFNPLKSTIAGGLTILFISTQFLVPNDISRNLHEEDSAVGAKATVDLDNVLFSGKKVRSYRRTTDVSLSSRIMSNSFSLDNFPIFSLDHEDLVTSFHDLETSKLSCDQWAVVSTTKDVSESIRRIVQLPRWCVVIVGDDQTPSESYEILANKHKKGDATIVYLPASYQKEIMAIKKQKRLRNLAFLDRAPFGSLARTKNTGFLFALQFGAKVIFDFDDDTVLTALEDGVTVPPPFMWETNRNITDIFDESNETTAMERYMTVRFSRKPLSSIAFNPYPLMGPSHEDSWPRGYPIDNLQHAFGNTSAYASEHWAVGDISYKNVGVIQSVINGDTDSDAMFRLTKPDVPGITFDSTPTAMNLLIPQDVYSPYNSKATTHLYACFWGLYLPKSVPERVADVWRSYITQRIMRELNLHLVYTPPIVHRAQIPDNRLANFQAESDLYHKTSKLLQFLDEWKIDTSDMTLIDVIYELWIALYERNFVGLDDVEAIQEWLSALVHIGYTFPSPSLEVPNEQSREVARVQPTMNGQPYRARPYFNVNNDGKMYAEIADHTPESWQNWTETVDLSRRPKNTVIKLIMMTMDEWPLLQTWTMFHGELMGFENLYVIDGSRDPRCISFLRYARDVLGMNVMFSSANLNELEGLMNEMALEIGGSADYILKVDTDEFIQAYDPATNMLSTSLFPSYAATLPYGIENKQYQVSYLAWSKPLRTACDEAKDGVVSAASTPVCDTAAAGWFKTVTNANTVFQDPINLGGHVGQGQSREASRLGFLHFHSMCYDQYVANAKKTSESHGYFNRTASDEEILLAAQELLGTNDTCSDDTSALFASWHKVMIVGRALQCPEKATQDFYDGGKCKEPQTNQEFSEYVRQVEEKYKVYTLKGGSTGYRG